ncbi:acyltransferase 3 [Plectosphaerella plurivora]|uniref:Acyltransferase 3 n=1 Tax=Plectosphaerella plurivora TaxID=936078 RepID=A0A9P9AFT2_9PEZI|nr:acyltransferase 3 [Plectosphaerella plurivora]
MAITFRWPSAGPALTNAIAMAKDSLWTDNRLTARLTARLHKTSYLDGLRGLAALVVAISHYTEDNHDYFAPAFGMNKGASSSILQLPFVRLIYAGRPMVHLLFVISGFVLAYKPLKAIQAGDLEECHALLASTAFRRPIRLFGPCVASTFFVLLFSYLGLLYQPRPSLALQIEDWWLALFRDITWPWSWDLDTRPAYDVHLWAIPVTFAHSMFLLMVVMVLAPLRRTVRRAALGLLAVYCLCCGRWVAFEFLGGCLLADAVLHRQEPHKIGAGKLEDEEAAAARKSSNNMPTAGDRAGLELAGSTMLILLFCFIASWPNYNAERTPGISLFHRLTPASMTTEPQGRQRFWSGLAALGLLWAISRLDALQRVLERPVCQYLGRISYALFLVHGPLLGMVQGFVVGRSAVGKKGQVAAVVGGGLKGIIGTGSPLQRLLVWVLGLVIMGPFIVAAADGFSRVVDVPVMEAARRFEAWCME